MVVSRGGNVLSFTAGSLASECSVWKVIYVYHGWHAKDDSLIAC